MLQAMPLLEGEEGLGVSGLPFTTIHWVLEKGIFAAPSHVVPFQQKPSDFGVVSVASPH